LGELSAEDIPVGQDTDRPWPRNMRIDHHQRAYTMDTHFTRCSRERLLWMSDVHRRTGDLRDAHDILHHVNAP
jgi:hypothetical protein